MKILTQGIIAFGVFASLAVVSQAAPLAANTTIFNIPGTTLAVPAPTVTPITSASSSFIAPATPPIFFTGTANSFVYQESLADNPLGGLTFAYDVVNDPTSIHALERITVGDFEGVTVDVGFSTSTGPAIPFFVDRSIDGGVIGMSWTAPATITPGTTSALLIIRTNATGYFANDLAVLDGAGDTVAAIGPNSGNGRTPEPASLGILSIGGLALLARRRKA